MSKSRDAIAKATFEVVATQLVHALEEGTKVWPLPEPPMTDPDFPPRSPERDQDLIAQGLSMLHADTGMFDRHLSTIVDLIVPHRMNLSDDPFEVHQKWLTRRTDDVAQRMLFCIATDWLAQAFDPSAPNTDRWWLAVSLINGLSSTPYGQPVHQGYHLVESIALAERPGTWHTQPEDGPQNMGWNPNAVVPRTTSVVAHDAGVDAAIWLLNCLENDELDRRLLLMEWVKLLLERPALIEPLGLVDLLIRRSDDEHEEVASKVILCLARLLEYDQTQGLEVAQRLHKREELLIRRGMADVLTRIFRRTGWKAVPFLDEMLMDEDESVLAAASATVGDLKFLDEDVWADRLASLLNHDVAIVRRNIVLSLRDYVEAYPDDVREIIPALWNDGDEVVQARLRELLMRMDEIHPDRFAKNLPLLKPDRLEALWMTMDARREGRSQQWKDWLAEEGSLPEPIAPVQEIHQSSGEAPEELPNLDDALDMLDDTLGFID